METKKCKKCEIEKPLDEYNRDKYSLDGLRYRCKNVPNKSIVFFIIKIKKKK